MRVLPQKRLDPKKPGETRLWLVCDTEVLGRLDVARPRTLLALLHLVHDRLAWLEGVELHPFKTAHVEEQILATVVGCDEPEAVLEDFDFTAWHRSLWSFTNKLCTSITPPAFPVQGITVKVAAASGVWAAASGARYRPRFCGQ